MYSYEPALMWAQVVLIADLQLWEHNAVLWKLAVTIQYGDFTVLQHTKIIMWRLYLSAKFIYAYFLYSHAVEKASIILLNNFIAFITRFVYPSFCHLATSCIMSRSNVYIQVLCRIEVARSKFNLHSQLYYAHFNLWNTNLFIICTYLFYILYAGWP